MTDKIVSGETTTNTFCYFYKGAEHMLKQADKSENGQLYNIISCITYCAFTLEAYFNHLGSEKISKWNEMEKTFSRKKRDKVLFEKLKFNWEDILNENLYESMTDIYEYRDKIVHGKTTIDTIEKPIEGDVDDLTSFAVGPNWKTSSTIKYAQTIVTDTKTIILEIHKAAGFKNNPFLSFGGGSYRIKTN